MKKLTCTRIFEIAYAHHLPKHKGKCKNLHGHNARLELTFCGALDPMTGMIVDFGDIKKSIGFVLERYDHKNLNDLKRRDCLRGDFLPNYDCNIFTEKHPPTAENFSAWLMEDVNWLLEREKRTFRCFEIKMWETATCFVTVTDPSQMTIFTVD